MWKLVSEQLMNIVEGTDLLANVYDFEASEISGTPIATITPSENENDYHSTTENSRVYAFVVRLYVDRPSGASGEKEAEDALKQLVDDVLDELDKNHRLPSLGSKTGYTFILMYAAPSIWGYAERDKVHRVAEINIRVRFSVDVNVIS